MGLQPCRPESLRGGWGQPLGLCGPGRALSEGAGPAAACTTLLGVTSERPPVNLFT